MLRVRVHVSSREGQSGAAGGQSFMRLFAPVTKSASALHTNSLSIKTLTWFWDQNGDRDPGATWTILTLGNIAAAAEQYKYLIGRLYVPCCPRVPVAMLVPEPG